MKPIVKLAGLLLSTLLVQCGPTSEIKPGTTPSVGATHPGTFTSLPSGLPNARPYIPGQLTYNSVTGNYDSNDEGFGVLFFTGPTNPPGSNAVFDLIGSDLPGANETTTYGPAPNTFSVDYTGATGGGFSFDIIIEDPDDPGIFKTIEYTQPTGTGSAYSVVIFYGKVVQATNGNFYAVATDYEIPTLQPKTEITLPPQPPGSVAVTKQISMARTQLGVTSVSYSTDGQSTWQVLGSTAYLTPGSTVYFQVVFANPDGILTDFVISLPDVPDKPSTQGGVQTSTTVTSDAFTVPSNDFTILLASYTLSITKELDVIPGVSVGTVSYSINGGSYQTFGTSFDVAPSSSVKYQAQFTGHCDCSININNQTTIGQQLNATNPMVQTPSGYTPPNYLPYKVHIVGAGVEM